MTLFFGICNAQNAPGDRPVKFVGKARFDNIDNNMNHGGIEIFLDLINTKTKSKVLLESTRTKKDGSYEFNVTSFLQSREKYGIRAFAVGYQNDTRSIYRGATVSGTVNVPELVLHSPKIIKFEWVYQPNGSRDFYLTSLPSGSNVLKSSYYITEEIIDPYKSGIIFSENIITTGRADVYFLDTRLHPNSLWANNGSGGTYDMGTVTLESVLQCPDVIYDSHEVTAIAGHTYCIKTMDGKHYAKIHIHEIAEGK